MADILEAIVARVPPPLDRAASPLRALIFDSYYDPFRGVIVFVRVVDGVMRRGDTVHFAASGMEYEVIEVGTLAPGKQQPTAQLRAGEVGYMHGAIKQACAWHVHGTCMARAWHVYGTCMARPQANCCTVGSCLPKLPYR